ncbi:MAG: gamma-glutamyltransferase [Pseudomonadota bacterium]
MANAMIVAPQPEAVEAGGDILRDGGNAIDAAIACALVQTAVDPFMCGIAGFGSMHVYMPSRGVHTCIDFHGRAPLSITPDFWADKIVGENEDGFGFILEGRVNEIGYQSITSPMSLRAFATALETFGTRKLGDLLQPAIAYSENGFQVRQHVSAFWNEVPTTGRLPHREFLTRIPATAKIYQKPDGSIYGVGETLRNPDMARTYSRIAEHGVDDFYAGTLAQEIVADMSNHDGLITLDDLAAARPERNEPLWGTYRGYQIATNNPPGGGVMILEMLNILEHFDLPAMGHNSAAYIATVSEAMKIATVDKDNRVGDPRFVDVPVSELTSKDYAAGHAERIKRGEKTSVPRLKGGRPESKDTTHISVVDSAGNCVSMTHSIGAPSGVVTDGLGFMYNGCMAVFDPRPGRAGSLAPGKSRFTAMCPTIVFKDGEPVLVIGAPGGTYITMGVLQGILNVLDFGMSALEAVSAPRFCTTSDTIDITNRVLRGTQRELEAMGYPVRRSALGFGFAGVHALRKTEAGWDGGADPGRDGIAVSVPA